MQATMRLGSILQVDIKGCGLAALSLVAIGSSLLYSSGKLGCVHPGVAGAGHPHAGATYSTFYNGHWWRMAGGAHALTSPLRACTKMFRRYTILYWIMRMKSVRSINRIRP